MIEKRSKTPKILFYVQHLLGIGHVFRATRVAKGLAAAGCETHIVWGGKKVPSMDTGGVEMHYLQAVHIRDGEFGKLLLDDGSQMNEAGKEARSQHLLQLLHDIKPDILITEAYPFGRRQMRFELVPLIEAAHAMRPRPIIVCSVRDILQENLKPQKVIDTVEAIKSRFDIVMVHGDPNLIRIETTFENAREFADKIRYSGLVTPDPVDKSQSPSITPQVIVSAGGGAVGKTLMHVAINAMQKCKTIPENWCLTTGPDLPQKEYDYLEINAPKGMKITRFIPDLTNVMAQAKVSVSRAGYNTVGDLLRARCPAVLVPFADGVETEQIRRAEMMAEQGVATVLNEKEFSSASLAAAVDNCANLVVSTANFNLQGARGSAQLLIKEFNNLR
ncbi:MAG: glycosyl transferase [Rhizobiaceae bacterium]|nr:glycosyl transferase [Rhizobiaceae bacterium]